MFGLCWYCYWGWAEPVAALKDRAIEELGETVVESGPAHIVFADENFSDDSIQWCISECDNPSHKYHLEAFEIARLRHYLTELLLIPEHIRCCEPKDYDGEHPENFPPTIKTVKQ